MDYLTFSIEISEIKINNIKKALRAQRGILYLNITLAIFQSWVMYHENGPHSWILAGCIGAFIANILWGLTHVLDYRWDLRAKRLQQERLKQMREDNNIKGAVRQFYTSSDEYNKMMAYLGSKINEQPSQPSGMEEAKGSEILPKDSELQNCS